MTHARSMSMFAIPAFFLGFVLGRVSLHVASAEGLPHEEGRTIKRSWPNFATI